MLAKTVTYKNFDGEEVTEVLHFHLSKAELVKMQLGMKGGLKTYLETIVKKEDTAEVIKAFDAILLASVGKRLDGKFIKTQDVIDSFRYSGAYEIIFMELLTDAEGSAAFVEAVMPKELMDQMQQVQSSGSVTVDLPRTSPDFSKMSPADFAEWQRRQQNPLGV